MGSSRQTNQKHSILCDWLALHICLSLFGPKLEAESVINKGSCQLLIKCFLFGAYHYSSYCLAFWTGCYRQQAGFLSWLLQVAVQSSIFIYSLVIVHMYIQSLNVFFDAYLSEFALINYSLQIFSISVYVLLAYLICHE